MKQVFSTVAAGVVGGALVLGATHFWGGSASSTVFSGKTGSNPNAHTVEYYGKPKAAFDFTEAAAKTMSAVVHIRSKATPQQGSNNRMGDQDLWEFLYGRGGSGGVREGVGSGVIIRNDGYIVTNNHVVKDATELEVTLFDKKKYKATIVGTDPTTDLAVIKIEATELPILDLADSDEARVGEWVLAVGNPMNLTSTVTAGIVSAKGRNINLLDRNKSAIESFIQTDAAVNPGNSGGALVDVNGKLLGINVAIASETGSYTGYSFAIPANLVKKVVEDIVEYGAPQRGFLGVNIVDMDADLSKEKSINLTNGVYVDRVVEGGSAEKAGIKSGDVIVGINGKTIDSSAELQEMVGRGRPGDSFSLTVNRKGKNQNIDVRLTRGATRE